MNRFIGAVAIVSATLGLPLPAFGVERDPAAAEVLFDQGRAAMDKKDFELACAKFAESQRLDPAAGTLMNLATCEEQRGLFASAWQHWQEALDQLAPGDDRTDFARSRVTALEPRVPYLTIQVDASAPANTEVARDGVVLGKVSWNTALPVDPGQHVIVARAPGYEERRFTVSLAEAQRASIKVNVGRELPQPPKDPASSPRGSSKAVLGYTFAGIGVVGLGTAVITGLMVSSRQNTVDEECSGNVCSPEGYDAAESGKTLLVVNAAAVVVGAAGIGAGAYFLLSARSDRAESVAQVRPVPGGATLSFTRSF